MLNKNFREFLKLLVENDVRFVVVGGYAVGVHGFLQVLTGIDGVQFSSVYDKQASGRSKDLIDLEELRRIKSGKSSSRSE